MAYGRTGYLTRDYPMFNPEGKSEEECLALDVELTQIADGLELLPDDKTIDEYRAEVVAFAAEQKEEEE